MVTDETARIFGDRYVLSEQLTSGDSREVWRAHDDIVSRQVALKIFFGETAADPAWQQAFRRTADRLAALSHPGIAKVHDHGESSNETWLAMAFVPGQTLADRLAGDTTMSPAQAADLVGQTGLALGAAHDAGIVHGDLSPSSLLVRDNGSPSLIGFAIDGSATRDDDLDALRELAATLLGDKDDGSDIGGGQGGGGQSDEITQFLTTLDAVTARGEQRRDATDIGRSALALSAALGDTETPAPRATLIPIPSEPADDRDEGYDPNDDRNSPVFRRTFDESEKKLVRNRLLILGTIVVVGGAALLRFIDEGAGEVTVPAVTNLRLSPAELKLTNDGLRSNEQCLIGKDSGGTITGQTPTAGHQVKAGSTITLTYTEPSCS